MAGPTWGRGDEEPTMTYAEIVSPELPNAEQWLKVGANES